MAELTIADNSAAANSDIYILRTMHQGIPRVVTLVKPRIIDSEEQYAMFASQIMSVTMSMIFLLRNEVQSGAL